METVAARIYGAIKEQIVDGRYAPGARITEQHIAAQFNTSRTPVREAMRQLVADGFALFKPNSGTVVRQWSAEEVRQLFELRLLIESQIAGHAAERIGQAQIAELEAIQAQIESGGVDVGAANTARIAPLNREFHHIIAQSSEHERLVAMLANTIQVPIVQRTFRRYSRERLARSFSHHRELIEALSAHDGAWAASVMSSHIHSAKQTLLENPV